MKETSKYTLEFLHTISSRLASRDDCKDVEYVVVASDGPHGLGIRMQQTIYVFPNTHRRRESDKRTILEYVCDETNWPTNRIYMVPGVYKYEKSVDGKRRRWTRV